MAISTDPITGFKIFNTRAAKATERIKVKGYSLLQRSASKPYPMHHQALFSTPKNKPDIAISRKKDVARPTTCPWTVSSASIWRTFILMTLSQDLPRCECEILVVGAGFAGLLLWHKLSEAGFKDVRFCEKGGDVGGTWYWNRYPGTACDVEAYSYLPLLEEMGYVPSMKFASGFEILEYCQSMAEKFGFYERCLFHTTVEATEWNENNSRWIVKTDRGDAMQARFVILANGVLTTPRLARIDGMEKFKGESFHTSRWNYHVDLTDKRVGIIGTGATAVQVIPEIAKSSEITSCLPTDTIIY